jgi:hypothetical protein
MALSAFVLVIALVVAARMTADDRIEVEGALV